MVCPSSKANPNGSVPRSTTALNKVGRHGKGSGRLLIRAAKRESTCECGGGAKERAEHGASRDKWSAREGCPLSRDGSTDLESGTEAVKHGGQEGFFWNSSHLPSAWAYVRLWTSGGSWQLVGSYGLRAAYRLPVALPTRRY
jgi:hypothetical protein